MLSLKSVGRVCGGAGAGAGKGHGGWRAFLTRLSGDKGRPRIGPQRDSLVSFNGLSGVVFFSSGVVMSLIGDEDNGGL